MVIKSDIFNCTAGCNKKTCLKIQWHPLPDNATLGSPFMRSPGFPSPMPISTVSHRPVEVSCRAQTTRSSSIYFQHIFPLWESILNVLDHMGEKKITSLLVFKKYWITEWLKLEGTSQLPSPTLPWAGWLLPPAQAARGPSRDGHPQLWAAVPGHHHHLNKDSFLKSDLSLPSFSLKTFPLFLSL